MSRATVLLGLSAALGACCGCGGSPTGASAAGVAPAAMAVICDVTALNAAGQQAVCQASLQFPDGSKQDQTRAAQWSSSLPAIASVSATGVVTATQPGTATITASYLGLAGSVAITVGGIAQARINSASMSTKTTTAIQGATVVRYDVTGSAGSTLIMNFGDGTTSSSPGGCIPGNCSYFEHVYSGPLGTYVATLTTSDTFGRIATATRSVTVTDLSGVWANTILNASNGRTETRFLTIAGGGTFTGAYTHPEGNSESLSGNVNRYGSVSLRLTSGTISMAGVDLDSNGVTSDSTLRVVVSGGSADGQTLTFTKR